MNILILIFSILLLFSCVNNSSGSGNTDPYKEGYIVLTEGEELEPYMDQKVQIITTVSNTKIPSIGNYWLTVMELEDVRDMRVHVWGTLIKREESSTLPDGTIIQGRDGVYYHLIDIGYEIVK